MLPVCRERERERERERRRGATQPSSVALAKEREKDEVENRLASSMRFRLCVVREALKSKHETCFVPSARDQKCKHRRHDV